MNDPLQRTTFGDDPTPRRWYLRVCECGVVGLAGAECGGFPGAWDEDLNDFSRSGCIGEVVEVMEVRQRSQRADA